MLLLFSLFPKTRKRCTTSVEGWIEPVTEVPAAPELCALRVRPRTRPLPPAPRPRGPGSRSPVQALQPWDRPVTVSVQRLSSLAFKSLLLGLFNSPQWDWFKQTHGAVLPGGRRPWRRGLRGCRRWRRRHCFYFLCSQASISLGILFLQVWNAVHITYNKLPQGTGTNLTS